VGGVPHCISPFAVAYNVQVPAMTAIDANHPTNNGLKYSISSHKTIEGRGATRHEHPHCVLIEADNEIVNVSMLRTRGFRARGIFNRYLIKFSEQQLTR
jgi:hypothetical protein